MNLVDAQHPTWLTDDQLAERLSLSPICGKMAASICNQLQSPSPTRQQAPGTQEALATASSHLSLIRGYTACLFDIWIE